jgi:hypothetical protein
MALAWLRESVRSLTPVGWCVAACLLLAAGLSVALGVMIYQAKAHATAAAKIEAALAQSRTTSAHDAVEITATGAARDAQTDATTRENADAIHHAPGADQRLDPGLNAAGLHGLCLRAAYHSRPECLQHPDSVQSSPAGSRR